MQILLAVVPILIFPVLWALFYKLLRDWRLAFLAACILWATYLVAVTELLSAFYALTFDAVLTAWLVALVAALVIATRFVGDPQTLWQEFHLPEFSGFEWFLLAGCVFIAVVVAIVGFVSPPNSYDSMTYHLPKVMHWIQDHSVEFYPTHILRQLYLVPGGEYIMLHLQLLAGSDRLDFLAEWFSMVGCAVGVSLIAAQLGARRRAQILSALIVMTIPTGVLQASSTQTDYITAFWLVCFVSWMLQLVERWDWLSVAAAGAGLGLAALTKGTTYIFALPFLVWCGVLLLRKHHLRAAGMAAAIIIFLVINLPGSVRNQRLFGNPLGFTQDGTNRPPMLSYKLSNDTFSGGALVSNVARNIGSHLGTPFPVVNEFFYSLILRIHRVVHAGINSPATTWPGQTFAIIPPRFSEVLDGNFLDVMLVVVCGFIILRHPRQNRVWIIYGLCLLAGFLLFCLYLRWQPFGARLQLPLFVLGAALLGKAIDVIRPSWIGAIFAVILLAGSLPWLAFNNYRPLVGNKNILNTSRTDLYFLNRIPSLETSYKSAAKFIAGNAGKDCPQVGLYMDSNDYEYPIWVLLQGQLGRSIRIESVDVQNVSRKATDNNSPFIPCAIFVRNPPPAEIMQVNGQLYSQAWTSDRVSVFLPQR
jgi:hypothetical protein